MAFNTPHILLTFGGKLFGTDVWQCGLRFGKTAWAPDGGWNGFDQIGLDQIFSHLTTMHQSPGLQQQMTTSLEWAKLAQIGTDGKYMREPRIHTPPTPVYGTGSTRIPAQLCTTITLSSGANLGKGNRGRIYLPAINYQVDAVDGRWGVTRVQEAAAQFKATLEAIRSEVNTIWNAAEPIIASETGGGTTKVVKEIWVGRVPDTQRRRRNAFREGYVAETLGVQILP